jgi:hypothetical protein
MPTYKLVLSLLARDTMDGGGRLVDLRAQELGPALAEAETIVRERAPEGSTEVACDYAAVVECVAVHPIRTSL